MRIQSALLQSEKVQVAQSKLVVIYKSLHDNCNHLLSATSKENRGAMLTNITNLVADYQSSAAIAFPKFRSFVDGAVIRTQTFVSELRNVRFDNFCIIYPVLDYL